MNALRMLAAAGNVLVASTQQVAEYERLVTGALAAERQLERYRRQLERCVRSAHRSSVARTARRR